MGTGFEFVGDTRRSQLKPDEAAVEEAEEPDVITYNAAISAFEKGQRWELALSLLGDTRRSQLKPDVISYNAAICACEKLQQWGQALSLLSHAVLPF